MMLVKFVFNVWEDKIVPTLSCMAPGGLGLTAKGWWRRWRQCSSCGEIGYIELYRLRGPSHVHIIWSQGQCMPCTLSLPTLMCIAPFFIVVHRKQRHTTSDSAESSTVPQQWSRAWLITYVWHVNWASWTEVDSDCIRVFALWLTLPIWRVVAICIYRVIPTVGQSVDSEK